MPCFRPLKGYRASVPNENGRFPVVFDKRQGFYDRPVNVPCGQCTGCRIDRARMWALRCVHESSLYEHNCFITLTYRDSDLPENGSLRLDHWQDFMKRFKSHVRYHEGKDRARGIRFYHCGEYGDRYGRPHYHALIFNYDFPDKVYKRVNSQGDKIYTSEMLGSLWPFGEMVQQEIGSVTYQSAAYVARYIMKKITGDDAVAYYGDRKPEYTTMSKGIGRGWFEKYAGDVFPGDYVVHEGKKHRVPRFYDQMFEQMPHDIQTNIAKVKLKRRSRSKQHAEDQTDRRLRVREKVLQEKVKQLKRSVE